LGSDKPLDLGIFVLGKPELASTMIDYGFEYREGGKGEPTHDRVAQCIWIPGANTMKKRISLGRLVAFIPSISVLGSMQ
jgi:hypothetical protein